MDQETRELLRSCQYALSESVINTEALLEAIDEKDHDLYDGDVELFEELVRKIEEVLLCDTSKKQKANDNG